MSLSPFRNTNSVPTYEDDPHHCEYCHRLFTEADYLALHRGIAHPDDLSVRERAEFERAREYERDEIRMYRLKAVGILVLVYFGMLMTYSVVA